MKISALILSMVFRSSYVVSEVLVPEFGGCYNETAFLEDPNTGFHCHFSSSNCNEGEEWLTPTDVSKKKLPSCTCDENYSSNVLASKCYSMQTHQVGCVVGGCDESLVAMGSRPTKFSPETCGHGSSAYNAFNRTIPSCGKRCTCNYSYQSRDNKVEAGSTKYGSCYNNQSHQAYCVVMESSCAAGEMFLPASHAMAPDCPCTKVRTGACVKVKNDKSKFEYCAVDADSCHEKSTWFSPDEVFQTGYDCRLCKDTWSVRDDPNFTLNNKSCLKMSLKEKAKKKFCDHTDTQQFCPIMCGKGCADDVDFAFSDLPVELPFPVEDCVALKMSSPKTKKTLCKNQQIKNVCARTCARCCSDDAFFTFKVTKNNGKTKKYNCKDLAKMNKPSKYCDLARVGCPSTCGACVMK